MLRISFADFELRIAINSKQSIRIRISQFAISFERFSTAYDSKISFVIEDWRVRSSSE